MSVSVIIPALNEESTVAGVIRACLADDPLEVLVIDADSTDDTAPAAPRQAGGDGGIEHLARYAGVTADDCQWAALIRFALRSKDLRRRLSQRQGQNGSQLFIREAANSIGSK